MFEQNAIGETHFLADVQRLCGTAREMMAARAAPAALLQTALDAEIACVLRYSLISVSADGLENEWVSTEFAAQAADERAHVTRLAARISRLGGKPDFYAGDLATRRMAPSANPGCLPRLVAENLAAEQCVIELYRELTTHFADIDPETKAILEDILVDEETHTKDLEDLLTTQLI